VASGEAIEEQNVNVSVELSHSSTAEGSADEAFEEIISGSGSWVPQEVSASNATALGVDSRSKLRYFDHVSTNMSRSATGTSTVSPFLANNDALVGDRAGDEHADFRRATSSHGETAPSSASSARPKLSSSERPNAESSASNSSLFLRAREHGVKVGVFVGELLTESPRQPIKAFMGREAALAAGRCKGRSTLICAHGLKSGLGFIVRLTALGFSKSFAAGNAAEDNDPRLFVDLARLQDDDIDDPR